MEPAREQLSMCCLRRLFETRVAVNGMEISASGQLPLKARGTELLGQEDGTGGGKQRLGRWSVLMTQLQ